MTEAKAHVRAPSGASTRPRRTVREHGPDPIDVHVGGRLRQARLLAGLSQEELGSGIGVSFQAVQKYEHGENRLSASRLFRAAKLLSRPVSFFFDDIGSDSGGAEPAGDQGAFTRDEIELVRHYRQIGSDDVREHLLQVTKRIGGLASGEDDGVAEEAVDGPREAPT